MAEKYRSYGFPAIVPAARRPIVGVVRDVKYGSLDADAKPAVYVVSSQNPMLRQSVVVGTSRPTR
jgi:hypothetical protein